MATVYCLRNSDAWPVAVDLALGPIHGGVTGITEAAAMGVAAPFVLIVIRREAELRVVLFFPGIALFPLR